MIHLMVYRPYIAIVVLHISAKNNSSPLAAFGFAPLGSEAVEKCKLYAYECPSHMKCVAYDDSSKYGECICERFYGFYGPTCEKLSVGSYLVVVMCIIVFLLMCRSLVLNVHLAYRLYQTGSLQRNSLCRCLFFNTVSTLPIIAMSVGCFLAVTSIDKQMFYEEYILIPVFGIAGGYFALSTLSVSFAWIETVEKTKRMPNSERNYKIKLYGFSLCCLVVFIFSFQYSIPFICSAVCAFLVSLFYAQAKRMVTEALSVMEENGDIIVHKGAADVLKLIKVTTRKMMVYTLLMSFSFFVLAFTIMQPEPKYKEQNSLPLYTQGQVGFLLVGISFYKINITLLAYLETSAKRHLDKPEISGCCVYCVFMDYCCSYLCCYRTTNQLSHPIQPFLKPSSFGESVEKPHIAPVSDKIPKCISQSGDIEDYTPSSMQMSSLTFLSEYPSNVEADIDLPGAPTTDRTMLSPSPSSVQMSSLTFFSEHPRTPPSAPPPLIRPRDQLMLS